MEKQPEFKVLVIGGDYTDLIGKYVGYRYDTKKVHPMYNSPTTVTLNIGRYKDTVEWLRSHKIPFRSFQLMEIPETTEVP